MKHNTVFVILYIFFIIPFFAFSNNESLLEITETEISQYLRLGKAYANEKLNGKNFKVRATIVMIDDNEHKVFVGDMYPVFFNQKDFDILYRREGQDIVFTGTIFLQNELMEGQITFKNCKLLEIIENDSFL